MAGRISAEFFLPSVMASIEARGFRWDEFQRVFPFGFLGIREGEYVALVRAVAKSLTTDKERALLTFRSGSSEPA